jgi:hypothetical protein
MIPAKINIAAPQIPCEFNAFPRESPPLPYSSQLVFIKTTIRNKPTTINETPDIIRKKFTTV